jgi:hypothetical protein
VRVDRVDRPLEAGPEQVDEGGVTDGARISTRADDRDRPGGEQPSDGTGLGPVLTRLHHSDRGCCRLDREDEMDGVLPVRAGRLVASIDKDAYHPDVVGEHVCLETADPALTRDGGQVLE